MLILLARHAETGKAYQGRYIGSTDLPLSELGRQQARDMALRLMGFSPVHCSCSPMIRTKETADIVCSHLEIPIELDSELVEVNFGAWEGLNFSEISSNYPDEVEKWLSEGTDFQFPSGDKNKDFFNRVRKKADLLSENTDSPLLVISHGGVIRTMICHFLGLSAESYLLFDVQPARFTVLEIFDQGGVLRGFNL